MEPIQPEVLIRQVDSLAGDLADQAGPVNVQLGGLLSAQEWAGTGTVYLTGDGDSYHAACAAEMAFESLAGVACEPLSALRFLEYCAPWLPLAPAWRPLVIAVSASGGTQRVVQAIDTARQRGALTVAVTGAPDSAVTRAADRAVVIQLDRPEPSPGIRTYQASLLGLLLAAIRLGEAREQYPPQQAGMLRDELSALAGDIAATASTIKGRCRDVADMAAASPVMVMTGSGPSYGTALFAAAKMTEAAGVFAAGQDLEEWCHVEALAYPDAMPVFVISPPGRSRWRAAGLAATARQQGRQVIAVTQEDDTDITTHAVAMLPVRGRAREEFSPLLYHVFAGCVASYLAQRLNRLPFQADLPPRAPQTS
jgi:glucosamine--fructose-6-phosphate aminotransferase (isomerizing)